MGILFLEYIDAEDERAIYKCMTCDTHLARVEDLASPYGDTCFGPVYTFSKMVNLKIDSHELFVQIFNGDESFLLDTDPLINSSVSTAHEFSCKKCNSLIGWKLLDPDRLLCLRHSIF
jgi:hypothetical protein